MIHFRVIINTLNIPFTKIPILHTAIFSHAGLLLGDEIFDFGDTGYKRRNAENCMNEFQMWKRGYPEGTTDVNQDQLEEEIIRSGEWTGDKYCFITHNCHDFVAFCLEKIHNPYPKYWLIYLPDPDIFSAMFGFGSDLFLFSLNELGNFFKTGGVEFIFPKIIPTFTKQFCFSNIHYICFKFHNNNKDIQNQVLKLINEKFLINNIKINSMDQLFSTILNELAIGYLLYKKLPYISLNFNNDKVIYSIQNDYYKHTLIGNIIAFLDFYLKCYVNGGFFKEEFIYEWHKTKNKNKEYLESNIILLHKYLFDIYKEDDDFFYYIFDELIKDENLREEHNYLIRYRIIGQIKNNIDIYKEILIPDCGYEAEADFTPFPILKDKIKEKNEIEKAMEKMRKLVYFYMGKIPYFQPYFEILRIITFCIHYLPNIQECGLFPDFSDSIQMKYPGIKYVRNVPPIFPQLPLRKIIKISLDINFTDILYSLKDEEIVYMNKVISYNYLEKKLDDKEVLLNIEKFNKSLEEIYKRKVKEKLGKKNEYLIGYFNLKKKGLDNLKNMFFENINTLIIKYLHEEYLSLFLMINGYKDICGEILKDFTFEKLFNLRTLKNIEDFINKFISLANKVLYISNKKFVKNLKNFEDNMNITGKQLIELQINNFYLRQQQMLFDRYKNMEKVNQILNKEENKKIFEEQKIKIRNDVEKQIMDNINQNKNMEQKFELIFQEKINKLLNALLNISNKIKSCSLINKNEQYENNQYMHYDLQFPKISYDSNIDLNNIINNAIGGCLPAINNNIQLNNIIMDDTSYKIIKENKTPNFIFKDKYYIIKSKLKQGFTYNNLILYNTSKLLDIGQKQIINSFHNNNNPNHNIKDFNGATITHYKMFLKENNNPNLIQENELNIKDLNGFRPEIYAILANNTKVIEKLFKLNNSDFSYNICDVANPFLFAIMTKNKEMINLFLNNYNKIGDLNFQSEIKNTPLHYLCALNMPEESFNLLQKVDRLDMVNKLDGNNPLQVLCINSNFETLKKILKYNKINDYINIKRYDNKSLLHFTSENSILCTKLLLSKNIDRLSLDKDKISPLEYAFFSGRYDCFCIINNNDINNDLFKKLNKNLNDFLKNIKSKETINHNNFQYDAEILSKIKNLMKNGNIKGIMELIDNNKKLNIIPFNDYKSCKKIVNCACKIGNIKFIEILLKLINHKVFPVAPFLGKYGLIKWVNDFVKYGINLSQSDKNVLEGKTIFDFCVESNNSKLYKLIFKNIESPNNFYQEIISKNFVQALLTKKNLIVNEIISQLEKPKFRKMEISIKELSYSINTTSKMLKFCLNLNFINIKTLDIFSAVKFCRPSVVRIILSLVINQIDEKNFKILINNIKKYGRLDNLLIINEKFDINKYYPNSINKNDINNMLKKIEKKAESPKTFAENLLIQKMKKYNDQFNICLLELPTSNTFSLHTFFKNNNFWILNCLREPFKSDLFIEDEKGINPFGYIRVFDKDFINIELEKIIYFFHLKQIDEGEKTKNILNVLDNVNNIIIRDKYEDKYISKVFNIIEKFSYIYKYKNEKGDNFLHILTKIKNINIYTIKNIIENFKRLKIKNAKIFKKLINCQNNEGETPIMNIFKSSNINYIYAITKEFNADINFYLFNIENNNLLHILFLNIKLEEKNHYENKTLYNILMNIFSKTTDIILNQNIKSINPCILSASSGCNIGLFLMHCLYNKEVMNKYNFGKNALCQACESNKINTVRYLVEYFNYDINYQIKYESEKYELYKMIFDNEFIIPECSTPLHISGYNSNVEVVKYLINNGANPFLQDEDGDDAISICLKNGNEEMLRYLFSTKIINFNNDNGKYILSLVKNKNANNYFDIILCQNSYNNIYIVDKYINNLMMLSCFYKNPEITKKLLNYDFDLLAKNKYGFNILHICCYKNAYSCAGIIFEYLYYKNKIDIIDELIYSKDNYGETPLHIVSEKNLYSFCILLLSHFIKNNKPFKEIKNNRNLTPIQLSIFKHNFEITLIYKQFLNINILDFLKIKIDLIKNEFDSFMYLYDSGYYKDLINEKDIILFSIKNTKKNINEKILVIEDYNSKFENKFDDNKKITPCYNFKNSNYSEIKGRLDKIVKNSNFNENMFYKYKSLFLDKYLILFLEKLKENEVKRILSIFTFIPYNNKIIMDLVKVFICCCLIHSNHNDLNLINLIINEMINTIEFLKQNEDYLNIPFSNFITQILVSSAESIKAERMEKILQNISFFRNFVESNNIVYLPLVKNLVSCIKYSKFLKQLNMILKLITDSEMKIVQIKYAYMIPPLLTKEIRFLLNNYPIINKYILSSLEIHKFVKKYLSKRKIPAQLLDIILEINEEIINNESLIYEEKLLLFELLNKMIKTNKLPINKLCDNLQSFTKLSITYLTKKKNLKSFQDFTNKNNFDFENILLELNSYTTPKKFNFNDYEKKLENILKGIKLLSDKEKNNIKDFALLLKKYYIEMELEKNFEKKGKELGQLFRKNPTIENSAKLIAIIMKAVEETMNVSPYLIQCISVETFLFHFINFKERKDLKGRLAQIKTGEGKSLIIAMISLANALMGFFVDVITSTKYLAKRDQLKYKKLFDLFGINSNNITKQYLNKDDYNGIILYGTNTDFEFSLLRENIFIENKIYTKPLIGNVKIKREYEISIVDECDNLFLDTALNSARISHKVSNTSFNWIYQPIFNFVQKGNDNINDLRSILLKYENGIYKEIVSSLNDKKLETWILSAKIALKKEKNLDYIVAFNKDLQKTEVQIVSKDTGRIQIGSRWTAGIHEFVEVKENLIPENESNIIGSISHPTYFENYKTIFGLTGTIGEEIERNEIMKMYKIDSYYMPRNFKEQINKLETEIIENKNLKFKRIIEIINKYSSQPKLIILPDIDNTLEFSSILKSLNIKHMILNDAQKENEDYILDKSGEKGNILIATNAAGRGTDIIISEESKKLGGLFVIFGFFPENSRIENQGIGRAGRQGNPGMNKIIFSKDELFINILLKMLNNSVIFDNNNNINSYYNLRDKYIQMISDYRMKRVESERKYFQSLKMFFSFKTFLDKILKDEYILNKLDNKNFHNINLNYYINNVIIFAEDSWSEFYSEVTSDRDDEDKYGNANYFNNYLCVLIEKWSKYCTTLYKRKIVVHKEDLFYLILSDIIDKWIGKTKIEKEIKAIDFEKFIQNYQL